MLAGGSRLGAQSDLVGVIAGDDLNAVALGVEENGLVVAVTGTSRTVDHGHAGRTRSSSQIVDVGAAGQGEGDMSPAECVGAGGGG